MKLRGLKNWNPVSILPPFYCVCPWCGFDSMDIVQTLKSGSGVHETFFRCPKCKGEITYRWCPTIDGKRFPARCSEPKGYPSLSGAARLNTSRTRSEKDNPAKS